ncbi:sialate O-acetylesterase [Chitinophaga filiformis]|uniref:Sialate O-acetylesterase n=1 Tax=Chitinophaga filiformis TaxID=104663 RepID=A0A1G7LUF5_CHIFI|nr:sialate O-acetylesterase [Chitinophaga filiformis]SDF53041.1 sialate O-acetylesterase [Chitinophaga filiformis]
MKTFRLFVLSTVISCTIQAQVRLPRLISDNMVLQRETQLNLWGWATPGENITISFAGKQYETITPADGHWRVAIPPMEAGGPYDMKIDASNHLTIKNILIGDVWLCSGQSNMELSMVRLKDKYPDVIAASTNPNIRAFNVATRMNWQQPLEDLETGSWAMADPESVLQFSGVGYFFAKELYEKYHIPIGIIRAATGGSTAEAWLSDEALQQFPAIYNSLRLRDQTYLDSIRKADQKASDNWYSQLWWKDKGMQAPVKWFDNSYNPQDWKTMNIPGYWHDQGLKNIHGVVWFRKTIQVPASMAGQPARLFLGNVVDRDSVYLNGQLIGTTQYQYPPRKYPVSAGMLKKGTNTIVVRVINYTGNGGFYKDKPYQLFTATDTIDLKGPWQYQLGAATDPIPPAMTFYTQPLGLYNGMIAPLLPYAIKGVIWYQGEANADRATEYCQIFSALIKDWRIKWAGMHTMQNFPFLYVQLTSYMASHPQPTNSNWALLREAQLKTLSVPNTAMTVTTDIGEWNDIHPLNKEDVGKRLALAARKLAYHDSLLVSSGPLYKDMTIQGNKIIIRFTNTGKGLLAKGGPLKYFAIAGPDEKFRWAHAEIVNNTVVVWHESVSKPVAVRYAWDDSPLEANLYNQEGLPASPFRTDNFKAIP